MWTVIIANTLASESEWLESQCESTPLELMTAFVAAPRHLRKTIVLLDHTEIDLPEWPEGVELIVKDWSLTRLCRVWLLIQLEQMDPTSFSKNIETLFDTAEINELVALYSALPVLPYPEKWLFRATEAVRSNMGLVFDAIAIQNPYPAQHFSEAAWNQLVLKTIFNDKPIHLLYGLQKRQNATLALTLSDFAHERWAAGRSVAPEVWRLTSPFMNERLLADMATLLASKVIENQWAAALACADSSYPPAHTLLAQHPDLERQVRSGAISWTNIEFNDLNTYVPQP